MKIESWDPDLQSLWDRHKRSELDLQPSFQRGLVWNSEKQARLVDTLMRGWRIPPVHFIVESDETISVLDGQQRLSALFDFLDDKFRLGQFAPYDSEVWEHSGRRFSELPDVFRRRLLGSRIAGYRLFDYAPDEPFELFFRLNLPSGLTQAEKRNALSGRTREQVRSLVSKAEHQGWGRDLIGFGDGRMAYDDVVARLCVYLDVGTLRVPLNPKRMEDAYRQLDGFSSDTLAVAGSALEFLTYTLRTSQARTRMNKATLLSWLLVAARCVVQSPGRAPHLQRPIEILEGARVRIGRSEPERAFSEMDDPVFLGPIAALYSNRASLRVSDVLSVQARDATAWLVVARENPASVLPPSIVHMTEVTSKLPYLGYELFERELLNALSHFGEWSELR